MVHSEGNEEFLNEKLFKCLSCNFTCIMIEQCIKCINLKYDANFLVY